MLPEGASPILKVDADEAREARAAHRETPRRGGRLLGAVFAFAAIVGFGSLVAYYFVQNRDGHLDPASIPIVHADSRPMKVRPENPGGLEVPFQNSEIYDRVAQQAAGAGAARTPTGGPEKLMPGPEAPLPRPEPPPAPVPAIPAAPEIVAPPNAVVVTPPRVASVPPASAPAVASPPPAPAAPAAAPSAPTAAAKPAATPTQTPASAAGGVRIQLASVRDQASAQREWARVSRQYGEFLGHLTPQFVPADLGDRGIFIRVQAGPFASLEAAKTTCDALRARGAGCNVVR